MLLSKGLKTASIFWTGSDVWQRNPDIFLVYNNKYLFNERVTEIVTWYKKFQLDFATLYFNEPDSTGHQFGPDSEEYSNKVGKSLFRLNI